MLKRIPRWLRWTALAAALVAAGFVAWRSFQYCCAPPPVCCAPPPIPPVTPPGATKG